MQRTEINPNQFLWAWVMSAIGIYPVVAVSSALLWSPVAFFLAILGHFPDFEPFSQGLSILALFVLPSLVIGYFVGDFQKNILRDYLDWELVGWRKQSLIGAMLGGAFFMLSAFLLAGIEGHLQWIVSMPIFVFALSTAQWWRLRHDCRDAWLWILANVVAGIIFSSFIFLNNPSETSELHPIMILGWWAVAAGAQGLVTGIVMLYLYERPIIEEARELAPVYLEVRHRDDR